ncbi:MAG TPA: hypothetical protein PLD20_08030 [Blastocatellia bacterium]|nr:hypothetical protein [Blastocatellia bacterium]HMV85536.1 hypothetical protein [Blastocatellia bacterium]HMY73999.1 hypothetical protein [Blastocatellia bacterium]HMZ17862.1 hypothetical protein [Blastocatellia bacterium]HNG32386.1 hypothetical protein [Blastocatellia bacterium]
MTTREVALISAPNSLRFRLLGVLPLLFFAARVIEYVFKAKTPEQILWSCHISNLMLAIGIFCYLPWLIRIAAFWQILGLPPWFIDMVVSKLVTPVSVFSHLGGVIVAFLALWVVRAKRGSWLPSLLYFIVLQQITRLLTVPGPYTNVNVAHFAYGGMKNWFGSYWTYWLANTAVTAVTLWILDWGFAKLFPPSDKH